VTRRQKRREARAGVRRASDLLPIPDHPYRDSAIFYAVLSGIVVGLTYATAGSIVRGLVYAAAFFVIATAFSWWRFRTKLAERERVESAKEAGARR
jgi:hypothetical protein